MKKIYVPFIIVLFGILLSVPAFAAPDSYTYIDSVNIDLEYDVFVAGETYDESNVSITVAESDPMYVVDTVKLNCPSNGWDEGDIPDLHVYLIVKDEDNYRFSYNAARPEGVTVGNGEAHYACRKSGNKKVYVEIYLDEVDADSESEWEESEDDGSWGSSDSSAGPGTSSIIGHWIHDPNNGWWYCHADRSYTTNNWEKISGKWYYFNQNGFALTNSWIKWKDKWYYCGSTGAMLTSKKTPDGYWVDANGVWDGKAALK